MELIAFFLVALFIITSIIVNVLYRSAKKVNHKKSYVLGDLGVQPRPQLQEDVQALVQHLEHSFQESYVERVKERVIREYKISLTEWENRFFEWKRYLVMTAILKKVPMYSHEVDEIWHEMLMFTREYEKFSNRFLGTTLHHEPNVPGQTVSESEKSFFDLIYLLLFRPTPYSRHTWGDFFRQPLSKALLDDIKHCSDLELKDRYFNPHTVKNLEPAARVMDNMIRLLKRKLEEVEKHVVNQGTSIKEFRRHFKKDSGPFKEGDPVHGAIFLSLYHADAFHEKYHELCKKSLEDDHGSVVYAKKRTGNDHKSSGTEYFWEDVGGGDTGPDSGNDAGSGSGSDSSGGSDGGSSCSGSSCGSSV
jgi:hypothetical protein